MANMKNEYLLKAIKEKGYKNPSRFAEAVAINYTIVAKYVSGQLTPFGKRFSLTPTAERICAVLNKRVDELWPEDVQIVKEHVGEDSKFAHICRLTVSRSATGVDYRDGMDPLDLLCEEEFRENFFPLISSETFLKQKESDVLKMRFGLDGSEEMTLEEVGEVYGITRERIRQIEQKAMRKIRYPSRFSRLDRDEILPTQGKRNNIAERLKKHTPDAFDRYAQEQADLERVKEQKRKDEVKRNNDVLRAVFKEVDNFINVVYRKKWVSYRDENWYRLFCSVLFDELRKRQLSFNIVDIDNLLIRRQDGGLIDIDMEFLKRCWVETLEKNNAEPTLFQV